MNLFHKYYNRAFLLALELLARLQGGQTVSVREAFELARKKGLTEADSVIKPLLDYEIVQRADNRYYLNLNYRKLRLPMQQTEKQWLSYMLAMPEARLLLEENLYDRLSEFCGGSDSFDAIQRYAPHAAPCNLQEQEKIRTLLRAIRGRQNIRYRFRTREQDRTIKAKLENILEPEPMQTSDVPEEKIEQAMERLLMPEPVRLAVKPEKGAVERCFLVFENQQFEETRQTSHDMVQLSFRWYRFDAHEIVRRLLYLGPMVQLQGPKVLQEELAAVLRKALSENTETRGNIQ